MSYKKKHKQGYIQNMTKEGLSNHVNVEANEKVIKVFTFFIYINVWCSPTPNYYWHIDNASVGAVEMMFSQTKSKKLLIN